MTSDLDDLHVVIAGVLTVWAACNIGLLRGSVGSRSKWCLVAALGAGEAFRTQYVHRSIDTVAGPGWDAIAYHGAFVIAVACAVDMLHLVLGRQQRVRTTSFALAGAALAASALPWVVQEPTAMHSTLRLVPDYYDAGWQAAVHTGVLAVYLGWAETLLLRHSLVHARLAGASRVGTGIRLAAAGVLISLACLAGHDLLELAWLFHGGDRIPAPTYGLLDALTLGPGALLVTVGVTWQRMGDLVDTWRQRRLDHALTRELDLIRPHWAWLVNALPEVSPFAQVLHQIPWTTEDLDFCHTRMAAEIHDATRRATSCVSNEDYDLYVKKVEAHGLPARSARAAVGYLCLQLGIRRLAAQADRPPAVQPLTTAAPSSAHIAADQRRLRRRRSRAAIADILREELP